jgi:hypothetical protein
MFEGTVMRRGPSAALLVLAVLTAAQAAQRFSNPIYPTGENPTAALLSDLDGDGRLDVVTANQYSHDVSVHRGEGNGRFGLEQRFPAGSSPRSLAAGDIDGDGCVDLVVADPFANQIAILGGNGDGTFLPRPAIAAPDGPFVARLGDFNHDGRLDLAWAGCQTNSVSVRLGKGGGSFGPAQTQPVGACPMDLLIDDFNGDGHADIVSANTDNYPALGNSVSLLRGYGNGTFQAEARFGTGAAPISLDVGDFDGDGRKDLIVANERSNDLSLLAGKSNGGFAHEKRLAAAGLPETVRVAQLDADGIGDLVVTSARSGQVLVLRGIGGGSFGAPVAYAIAGAQAWGLAVGRIDSDAFDDVAATRAGDAEVQILLSRGDGSLGGQRAFGTGEQPRDLAVADFNEDGRADLATANSASGDASVLLGNGDGTLAPETRIITGLNPVAVARLDANGDGHDDLAVLNAGNVETAPFPFLSVLPGSGTGTFGPAKESVRFTGAGDLAVGDLNGDGRDDTVINNYVHDEQYALLSAADGSPGPPATIRSGLDPPCLVTADVDADGTVDVLMCGNRLDQDQRMVLLPGLGNGAFGPERRLDAGPGQASLAIADFNADGILDIAATTYLSQSQPLWILMGTGQGAFAAAQGFGPVGSDVPLLAVADFNNDDKLDLAVTGPSSFAIYTGVGDGSFLPPALAFATLGTGPSAIVAADFDLDGRTDVALTSQSGRDVRILLNEGNHRPTAAAGADRLVEATGTVPVELDGSGSTDADSSPGTRDDIVEFAWREGATVLASGERVTVPLGVGAHALTLQVTDREGSRAVDGASIVVGDNCPGVPNPTQQDADLDGHGAACDCADLDPQAWAVPMPVGALRVAPDSAATLRLEWDSLAGQAGPAVVYDAAEGSIADLRAHADFRDASCIATGLTASPALVPLPDPLPGEARYVLLRGRNVCGAGSFGAGSALERVIGACP